MFQTYCIQKSLDSKVDQHTNRHGGKILHPCGSRAATPGSSRDSETLEVSAKGEAACGHSIAVEDMSHSLKLECFTDVRLNFLVPWPRYFLFNGNLRSFNGNGQGRAEKERERERKKERKKEMERV